MDPEEYRKKIERDILEIMEEKLRNGEMDAERAKAIAKMVLEKLHPPLTLEQIYIVVPTLDDHFTELTKAVLPIIQDHDDQVKDIISKHAEKLITSGKVEEAYKILKQANTPKDKLS